MRVTFSRPNFKNLEGTCVDMHSHSKFSDGRATTEKLMAKAKKQEFGFALTDHNTMRGVVHLDRMRNGVLFIPGMEVSSSEGMHLLVYCENVSELSAFYTKCVHRNLRPDPISRTSLSLVELIEEAKAVSAVTSIAHPFGPLWTKFRRYLKHHEDVDVDAFEGLNGEQLHSSNKRSVALAFEKKTSMTAGSDAHTLGELGRVVTRADTEGVADFLEAVRKGNVELIGKEIVTPQRIIPHATSIKAHVKFTKKVLHHKWLSTYRPKLRLRKDGEE